MKKGYFQNHLGLATHPILNLLLLVMMNSWLVPETEAQTCNGPPIWADTSYAQP